MLRIVSFFYNTSSKLSFFFNKLSKRFAKAALELNILKYHIQFGEREDDIYIVTYPKSGTTLMQMIVYQIVTDGSMDFDHIYDVSPWTDNDAFLDLPPRELKSPRIIKSHRIQQKFDRDTKGKFIVVVRNGIDVAVSQFHQNKNYNDSNLKFDEFYDEFLNKKENWFEHCQSWFKNKNKSEILYINYEELISDFDTSIKKVAKFINCEINPKDLPRIRERCSFAFMKENEEKFGDKKEEKKQEKIYNEFIRKGKVGEGISYLSKKQNDEFQKTLTKYNMNN
ncbi:MAG: sulfotransferase domain-containing protein [Flavobacteriales bacterium]|nr:sulfotransferase domain-containing protein [Flavobacteriales bacterium]